MDHRCLAFVFGWLLTWTSSVSSHAGDLRDQPIEFSKMHTESVFKVVLNRPGSQPREVGMLVLSAEIRDDGILLQDCLERPNQAAPDMTLRMRVRRDGLLSLEEVSIGDVTAKLEKGKLVAKVHGEDVSDPFDGQTLTVSAAMRLVPLLPTERGARWDICGPVDFLNGGGAQTRGSLACQGVQKLPGEAQEVDAVLFTADGYEFYVVEGRLARVVLAHGEITYEATDENPYSRRNEVLPEVEVKALPFKQALSLKDRQAVVLRLPDGKALALWCLKAGDAGLQDRLLTLEWGQSPFQPLETERVPQGGGSFAFGEYKDSYIRRGAVMTSSSDKTVVYHLYASKYRVAIADMADEDGAKSLQVSLEEADEDELLTDRDRREAFVRMLKSEDPAERAKGLHGLRGMLGSPYAGDRDENLALIRPLLSEPALKEEALEGLLALEDPEAAMGLLDSVPSGQWTGIDGGWRLANRCRRSAEDPRVVAKIVEFIGSERPEVRDFALGYLRECYFDSAIDPLEALIDESKGETRIRAYEALLNCARARPSPDIVQHALEDTSKEVLLLALRETWRYLESLDIAPIVELLKSPDAEVRAMAAHALDCCDRPEARGPLLEATRDEAAEVRGNAAVSLGRAGVKEAYGRLVEMLEDPEPRVRHDAINALRWLGDARAVQELRRLLEGEKDDAARQMAERTIREIEGR